MGDGQLSSSLGSKRLIPAFINLCINRKSFIFFLRNIMGIVTKKFMGKFYIVYEI